MTNSEKIIVLANQIANDGKKPTVALIKAKLANPTPLPQIISVLKSWNHDPDNSVLTEQELLPKVNNSSESSQKNVVTLALLNETLAPIKKELAEIKSLLQALSEK